MNPVRFVACSLAVFLLAASAWVTPSASAAESHEGYWLAGSDGGVFAFGDAPFLGSTADLNLRAPIVGIAGTPTGQGYWLAGSDGGVFAFGDAPFLGSTADLNLRAPIVGIAGTPTGQGYWLAGSDGGVFAFGDAPFLGVGGVRECEANHDSPCAASDSLSVVAIAGEPDDVGYVLLERFGRVWNFGAADAQVPVCPIFTGPAAAGPDGCATGIAATPAGRFVVSTVDGFVLSNDPAPRCDRPEGARFPSIVGVAVNRASDGCWLAGVDGGVFALAKAQFLGSVGDVTLRGSIVGVAPARP